MSRTLIAVLLVVLGACSDPVLPRSVRADFASSVETSPPWRTSIQAESGARQIAVRGFLRVPSGGYSLSSVAMREGREITLRIRARQVSAGIDVYVNHRYDAVLRDLPPGSYQLRVVHELEGTTQVALEEAISVE